MDIDPQFAAALKGFDADSLDAEVGSSFGLTGDLRLGLVNEAWWSFASANRGTDIPRWWGVGADVLAAVSEPLRSFYQARWLHSLRTATPWVHLYECSSATTYRKFQMRTLPLPSGRGLIVVNSCILEYSRRLAVPLADVSVYRGVMGIILQCAHCRRTRRAFGERWDWVPQFLDEPQLGLSFGLCPVCRAYYYSPREGLR